jgi:hypothetical protein
MLLAQRYMFRRVSDVGLLTLQELPDLLEYKSFVGRTTGETGG